MTHAPGLATRNTAILLIDVQERLAAAMPAEALARCVKRAGALLEAGRRLGLPVLVTEQYPKGLGPTVPELCAILDEFAKPVTVISKVEFDATKSAECRAWLQAAKASHEGLQVVVAGMEAHICVAQTVRGLRDEGITAHVALDATCSRAPADREVAVRLWERAGGAVTCTEAVLFELLENSKHPEFKEISKLIR